MSQAPHLADDAQLAFLSSLDSSVLCHILSNSGLAMNGSKEALIPYVHRALVTLCMNRSVSEASIRLIRQLILQYYTKQRESCLQQLGVERDSAEIPDSYRNLISSSQFDLDQSTLDSLLSIRHESPGSAQPTVTMEQFAREHLRRSLEQGFAKKLVDISMVWCIRVTVPHHHISRTIAIPEWSQ